MEDVDKLVLSAKSNSSEMQKAAKRGQDMVCQLHSVEKRSQQVVDLVEAVLNGGIVSTKWTDGELVIEGRSTNR